MNHNSRQFTSFPSGGSPTPARKRLSSFRSVRQSERDFRYLQKLFTPSQRIINDIAILAWILAFANFWWWWFQPEHYVSLGRFAASTIVCLWISTLPAYFLLIVRNGWRVPIGQPFPEGLRVASIVTKAPSEPFAIVQKTLEALLAQEGAIQDVWLADEDPTPETRTWCRDHGVKLSTRHGVISYQREDWPRRMKSKEGNLTFFYDTHGYADYDIVHQFDADHVPQPDYVLRATIPFRDPIVGYVSSPSICDANAASSWAARGRLYVEGSMHGALQAGYNGGFAPLCIGSHYSVRTAALKDIGGLGPELAEDHSTTLLMNAYGWRGVHAIDAIAHGEGPETFADLAMQEFQWSRSLVTILLDVSPSLMPKLPWRLRFEFLFSQLWYPTYSLVLLLMFVLPIYALVTKTHLVNVTYLDFIMHLLPLSALFLAIAYWWRSLGLFRPENAEIISWEGVGFVFARWPWMLIGSVTAVLDFVLGKVAGFRVTPKGRDHKEPVPFRAIAPYLLLSATSGGVAFWVEDPGTAAGFYIFNLSNALAYAILVVVILWRHAADNRIGIGPFLRSSLGSLMASTLAFGLFIGASYQNGSKGLASMTTGVTLFTFTEIVFSVSGAGRIARGNPIIRFKPQWYGLSGRGVPDPPRRRD